MSSVGQPPKTPNRQFKVAYGNTQPKTPQNPFPVAYGLPPNTPFSSYTAPTPYSEIGSPTGTLPYTPSPNKGGGKRKQTRISKKTQHRRRRPAHRKTQKKGTKRSHY